MKWILKFLEDLEERELGSGGGVVLWALHRKILHSPPPTLIMLILRKQEMVDNRHSIF